MLVISSAPGANGYAMYISFNSDTTNANYSSILMTGNGSSTSSGTQTSQPRAIAGEGYVYPYQKIIHLMDYSATDKHKTFLARTDGANDSTQAIVTRWANTAAITSIAFALYGGNNMAAGTSMALYGVSA